MSFRIDLHIFPPFEFIAVKFSMLEVAKRAMAAATRLWDKRATNSVGHHSYCPASLFRKKNLGSFCQNGQCSTSLASPRHAPKTDAPLVVNSYAHLACSLSF
jgi:hypothetical protein